MRGSSEIGRVWMNDSREPVCRRSAPFALCPASAKLVRTPLSRPNSRNAARIDSRVRMVRVLRRNSSDQIRGRYFIDLSFGSLPCDGRGGLGGGAFRIGSSRGDRKGVVYGTSGSVRLGSGGPRII